MGPTFDGEGQREAGHIASVFVGEEDHGIPTVSVHWHGEGGSAQSFGNLALDRDLQKSFVADLCAAFGVGDLERLTGIQAHALRESSFGTMAGLEAPNGTRFLIDEWRAKHFPHLYGDSPEAIAKQVERLDEKLLGLRRQRDRTCAEINETAKQRDELQLRLQQRGAQ